jgi:hypothetical protein
MSRTTLNNDKGLGKTLKNETGEARKNEGGTQGVMSLGAKIIIIIL